MASFQKLTNSLYDKTSNASNNIINFSNQNFTSPPYLYKDIVSGEKVILSFLISLIYLFSALEEADWNILSSGYNNPEEVHDKSSWNIYQIIKK